MDSRAASQDQKRRKTTTMSPDRWRQVKEVFHAALEREPSRRAAFVEEACAGDEPLRSEVKSLLASDADGLPWLANPVFEAAAEMLASDPGDRLDSRRIGPYKLIRELGQGGMGTVYLAERADEEFQRQVAVKLLKRGMDSQDILRRFRQERQILASLDHPYIARLLEGGMTPEGDPYFIMEYVEGEAIDAYCDRRALSLDARLGLFRSVCSAVRYAHRHLVVHCDLKPSNILVTAEGVPKLLDFGIARLLGSAYVPRLAATTVVGGPMMTPEYASPEQARGERVTTASDVYSLGVLLYKLVAGQPPYRLENRSPGEIEQVICDEVPRSPSVVLGRRVLNGRLARQPDEVGAGTLRELRRRLVGDLDNIVMMALDKDPGRRYGSVEQLSEDLRRHREDLPVVARRDTRRYRAGKFIRRHRVGTAAAALVALSLVAGVVATTWQAREARAQRERARVQQVAAEQVADFLARLLREADPFGTKGETVSVRELLDEGAKQMDRGLHGQPEIRARMMDTIGVAYMSLGLYDEAFPLLQAALEIRRQVCGEETPEVAESLNNLGRLWRKKEDLEAAEPLIREALALRRRVLGEESAEVAESLEDLATLLFKQGEYDDAELLLRKALDSQRRVLGEESPEVADSLNLLALLLRSRGEYLPAESLYREALALNRRLFGERHPRVAIVLDNLGGLLRLQGEFDEAELYLREALALLRETLGEEHPYLAACLNTLAVLLKDKGDYGEAEPAFREVLELQRKVLGSDNPAVARTLNNLAALLYARGEPAGAESLFAEALAMYRRVSDDRHPEMANPLHHLGVLRHAAGSYSEAESYLREALELRRELLGAEHSSVAISLLSLGQVLIDRGQPERAEGLLRKGLEIRERKLPQGHWLTAKARGTLGGCLTALRRYGEAEPLLLESLRILRAKWGDRHQATLEAQHRVIALYEAWGRPSQADLYRTLSPSIL